MCTYVSVFVCVQRCTNKTNNTKTRTIIILIIIISDFFVLFSTTHIMDIDAQYAEIAEAGERLVRNCESAAAAQTGATHKNVGGSMYDSLLDNPPIQPEDVSKHGVIINVPTFYISCDEQNGYDQSIMNLRVIDSKVLLDLVNMVRQILENSVDQCEFSTKLMNRLVNMHSQDINNLLDFMNKITTMSRSLDLDDNFYDLTSTNISFDRIRNYVVDPETGVLQTAEPTTYMDKYQLYSQLYNTGTHDEIYDPENMQLEIRKATNDSDFNRMQYYLLCVEKFLLFREGYVCESTAKLGNLALFHLCLISESRPIMAYSSNDLRGNILSYMIDMVVRSRVIQMWQRYPTTARLLNDMVRNYDGNNHLVKLCQMKSARDRAQYILNSLKNIKDNTTNGITDTLNYDAYFTTLQQFQLVVDGKNYYSLGNEFITKLGMASMTRQQPQNQQQEEPTQFGAGSGGTLFENLYRNTDKIEELLSRGCSGKK